MKRISWLWSKDGKPSKTAIMLWLTFAFVAFKYITAGMTLNGHTFPEFDIAEAMTFLGTVSGLYLGSNRVWQNPNKAKKGLDDLMTPENTDTLWKLLSAHLQGEETDAQLSDLVTPENIAIVAELLKPEPEETEEESEGEEEEPEEDSQEEEETPPQEELPEDEPEP